MLSLKMRELGLTKSFDGHNTITDADTLDKDAEMRLKLAMRKELKVYNMPKGGMTGFQAEIILSRVLQKHPDVTHHGIWKDCAQ